MIKLDSNKIVLFGGKKLYKNGGIFSENFIQNFIEKWCYILLSDTDMNFHI